MRVNFNYGCRPAKNFDDIRSSPVVRKFTSEGVVPVNHTCIGEIWLAYPPPRFPPSATGARASAEDMDDRLDQRTRPLDGDIILLSKSF